MLSFFKKIFYTAQVLNKTNIKFLIYGSSGWIGGLFIKYIEDNRPDIEIITGNARIDNKKDVMEELHHENPTHVISFTGRTHGTIIENGTSIKINTIDYLEYPDKLTENIRDNLFGPLTLVDCCEKLNIHYTYIGTGCIFNNRSNESYDEDDVPNFFGSNYSIVKGFTDRLMHNYDILNLRIRMPISKTPDDRNFITKITKYSKICSVKNSMTVLDDFFPIFTDLMLKQKTGTYNCTNPGVINHNNILKLYRSIVNPKFKWKNMSLKTQSKILKSKRSNNYLDTSKIQKEYPNLMPIDKSIEHILQSYFLNV